MKCPGCGGRMQLPGDGEASESRTPPPRTGRKKVVGRSLHPRTRRRNLRGRGPRVQSAAGTGVKALVFGILGLTFCAPIFGPMAMVYGKRAQRNEGEKALGTVGYWLGVVCLLEILVGLVWVLINMGWFFAGGAG